MATLPPLGPREQSDTTLCFSRPLTRGRPPDFLSSADFEGVPRGEVTLGQLVGLGRDKQKSLGRTCFEQFPFLAGLR
jgi:hypothetical protein